MADKKNSANTGKKDGKSAAGSALTQHPMSKAGKITSRQADKAVRDYLSGKRA